MPKSKSPLFAEHNFIRATEQHGQVNIQDEPAEVLRDSKSSISELETDVTLPSGNAIQRQGAEIDPLFVVPRISTSIRRISTSSSYPGYPYSVKKPTPSLPIALQTVVEDQGASAQNDTCPAPSVPRQRQLSYIKAPSPV